MLTAKDIIAKFDLIPHPEGGFYKETYRSVGQISSSALDDHYSGSRNFATSIYFLLTSEAFSAFHKIKQDEIWHFYEGNSICIHSISPSGIYSKVVLGMAIKEGEVPQYVVPGGHWFAAEVLGNGNFGFVGCTVSPGFDFADFELANGSDLMQLFPAHQLLIKQFTRV